MINQPLVSIAVCTYNGAAHLEEQLLSLINQTYKNLEFIVVDDLSSDNTLEILRAFSEKDERIKIYPNEVNLGYIKNFEKAITLCNGEFIALCDQDDIWLKNKIELQLSEIEDNILIYHDSEFINEHGVSLNKYMSDVINMYSGDSFKPFLFFNCLSGHAALFKRQLIEFALPFPKEIFHDRWLAFTATNLGSIKYINEPLVKYRQHENSDTNILKLKRAKAEHSIHGKTKIVKALVEYEIFAGYKFLKNRDFVKKLLRLYKTRLQNYFCFSLIFFMYGHYKSLLFISKKGTLSKLNFIFKHVWGSKLKKA